MISSAMKMIISFNPLICEIKTSSHPPNLSSASYKSGFKPSFDNWYAAERPIGPPPIIAILLLPSFSKWQLKLTV